MILPTGLGAPLILPERGLVRLKLLPAIPERDWRAPPQAQPKNMFGHENQTRFRVRALTHDGVPRWVGWFDDRADADAFLDAIANDTLRYDRAMWDLPAETWMPQYGYGNVGWRPDLGEGLLYDFVTLSFIVTGTTSWPVPADCKGVQGGSGEFIDTIGAGGTGACCAGTGGDASAGGGGGAWGRITSLVLTPGGSVTVQVGAGGAALSKVPSNQSVGNPGTGTWFNGSGLLAASVSADFGRGGPQSTAGTVTGAAGGLATNGTGTSTNNGGNGGGVASANTSGAGGGGGAAGPNGAGTNASTAGAASPTNGGSGDAGSGGAGSAAATANTTNPGGAGTEYDGSHGSGGGSGGMQSSLSSITRGSGAGGAYGAGSGAGVLTSTISTTAQAGQAGDGLIVVSYIPRSSGMIFQRSTRFFTRKF